MRAVLQGSARLTEVSLRLLTAAQAGRIHRKSPAAGLARTGPEVAGVLLPFEDLQRSGEKGMMKEEATEVSRSRKLSVCTVRVTNDAGELVALFQGTAYITDEPFPIHTALDAIR